MDLHSKSLHRSRSADSFKFSDTSLVNPRPQIPYFPQLTRKLSQYFETPPPGPSLITAPPPSPEPHMSEESVGVHKPIDIHEEDGSNCVVSNLEVDIPACDPVPNRNLNSISLPPGSKWQGSRSKVAPFVRRFKPALTLENRGSVARDHLASERTFLAYVRTSLAIASAGVALVQFFTISSHATPNSVSFTPSSGKIQVYARPLGGITIVMALMVLAIGITRYFSIQQALTKGNFPVARLTVMAITIVLGMLVATVFGALVRK